MTDPEHPELLRFLDGPPNTWTIQRTLGPAAPARLTFQAGALPFGAKIELQAVAAAPDPAA